MARKADETFFKGPITSLEYLDENSVLIGIK